jgi:HTH-type transcriptional regulator/antitoxin HipB
METIVRTEKQIGAAVRRFRRQQNLSQAALGDRMHARQASVSKLEAGEPATQLRMLTNALAALGLELVMRPRSKASDTEIEELF